MTTMYHISNLEKKHMAPIHDAIWLIGNLMHSVISHCIPRLTFQFLSKFHIPVDYFFLKE